MQYTGWIGTVLVMTSLYLTGNMRRSGFIVGAVAEVFWLAYGIYLGMPELAIMSFVFVVIYVRNFRKWSTTS